MGASIAQKICKPNQYLTLESPHTSMVYYKLRIKRNKAVQKHGLIVFLLFLYRGDYY